MKVRGKKKLNLPQIRRHVIDVFIGHVGVVTSWFEVDGGVTDFRDRWRERSRGHFRNYLDGL